MLGKCLLLIFLGFGGSLSGQNEPESQKRDLERVLSAAVPFARQMLTKEGEFFPYGSSMNADGKIAAVGAQVGNEHPKSAELIGLLRGAFQREAESGKIRACAVVYDTRVVPPGKTEKIDAIAVELDHSGGMSIAVIYPYRLAPDKKLTLGESYVVKGQGKIFAGSPRL